MRLTWLADKLRAAGLTVVEVDGWKTRGVETFAPVGVTWHATAGSRKATAMGEVGVILHGSETAPPPIAQLMIWRDGTVYVCAAGRCHHNKVGWAGPNKGLGNTALLGIEMANDNSGEPWPVVQLDAARVATAVIMTELGADPLKRLAAHYEHQPYEGRPVGETSTKSDPFGVIMTAERPRVRDLMEAGIDMTFEKDQVPVGYPIASATNPTWTGPNALGSARDYAHRTYDAVMALRQTQTLLLQKILDRDTFDEVAFARELAPAVAAAVLAEFPADRDDITVAELTEAIRALIVPAS